MGRRGEREGKVDNTSASTSEQVINVHGILLGVV